MKQCFEASNENIQLLADRFEISNLLLDFAAAIDARDMPKLARIFTTTAHIDRSACGGVKGRYADLETLFEQPAPAASPGRQWVGNADIRIESDTASATIVSFDAQQELATDDPQPRCCLNSMLRTDAGWRIVAHVALAEDCN